MKAKLYQIGLCGFSDSDCSETVRMLTEEQYKLLTSIFDDLMKGQGCGDYAPAIRLDEIKVTVRKKVPEAEGKGTIVYCENAAHVKVGQKMVYKWNGDTTFKVVAIGNMEHSFGCDVRPIMLSPNKNIEKLNSGSTLETEYEI